MTPIITNPLLPVKGHHNNHEERANDQNENQKWQPQLVALPKSRLSSISFKDKGNIKNISLHDIVMFEAESNYTIFHICDGSKIMTCKTLKYWKDLIGENPNFIRPHRSYLLNRLFIDSFQDKTRTFLLSNKRVIPLARRMKLSNTT